MRSRTCCLAVLLAVALCGCRSHDDPNVARLAPRQASGANPSKQIVAANTRFGINVLRDLVRQQPNQNVIISPVSLGLALAMTYNGAGTTTRDAIGKTLQVDGLPIDQVNSEYQALGDTIGRADPQVAVDIANSLWLQRGHRFAPPFLALCRQFYDAEVSNVNLNSSGAAPTINAWASQKTHGSIPEIVTPQDLSANQTVALLLSGVYFSAKWAQPFHEGYTQPHDFKLTGGRIRKVPMMAQDGKYPYQESPTFQAIVLPYASGHLSFCVFLPKATSSLAALCQGLTSEKWHKWMSRFSSRKGFLNLPKLRVQPQADLNVALKDLGMTDAFDAERADFSPMSPRGGVWIGDVRQRMYLRVWEQGTDAAALTATMFAGGETMGEGKFYMHVDHPFLFAIRDNATGAILFMGVVTDPGESPGMGMYK